MWDGYPEYRHGYMWCRLIWVNISYANMHKVWLGINAWSLLYWWYHWIIIWRRDTKLRHPVFLDRLVSVPLVMSPSLNPTSSSLTAPPSRLSSLDLSVFALYSTAYSTAVSTGVRADRLFSYPPRPGVRRHFAIHRRGSNRICPRVGAGAPPG